MAGCKSSLTQQDIYGAYDAQNLAIQKQSEVDMIAVPSLNLVYTDEEGYITADEAKAKGLSIRSISGTKFRQMLRSGDSIPEWFSFSSVVDVLRNEVLASKE